MGWRAEPAPHTASGGRVESEGNQVTALEGAEEAGDIVGGGLGLPVGLVLRLGDLAELLVGGGQTEFDLAADRRRDRSLASAAANNCERTGRSC